MTDAQKIRKEAIAWWKNQSEPYKESQFLQYRKEYFTPAQSHTQLTGREIQKIYFNIGLSERAIKSK